jgi:hypothetical protein
MQCFASPLESNSVVNTENTIAIEKVKQASKSWRKKQPSEIERLATEK